MSVKILGGLLKNLQLTIPESDEIRPMSVMLRRRIFDAHQDLSGYSFLDLCAGSGAVGIEAWSRGADKVFFVEKSKFIFDNLTDNIAKAKAKEPEEAKARSMTSFREDATFFIKGRGPTFLQSPELIIFFAPPYPLHDLYLTVFDQLLASSFKGQLWVESCRQKALSQEKIAEKIGELDKVYEQGTSFVGIKRFS